VPGAASGSYTTSYAYDALGEPTSVTDANGDVTGYAYDNVGNTTAVTDPNGNTIKYGYSLDTWPTQVTDAAGNTESTGYDLDGNVISKTDQNGAVTLYTIDPDGLMTQAEVPYSSSGGTTTYHTTQYHYDQDGNQTEVIDPRGVASGTAGAYSQVTKYNADGQVSASLGADNPSDPVYNTAPETGYTYYPTGQVKSVTAPPSSASTGPNVTTYNYFDNGWTKSATDPWNVTTSYAYDSIGDQTQQSVSAAGGSMTRSDSWSYFPDGSLASRTDAGIPTGLYAEEVDNSDFDNTSSSGTWTSATGTNGDYEGYNYQTHAAGSGSDQFTWHLNIPADGNYAVYVKYPQVSGAATNASYKVSYSGGAATATADQTQNAGTWVKLGTWAFTQAGTGQQIALSENSGGTVSADAVKVVRDDSSDTNTATETYSYGYDANGQATSISDSGNGSAQTSYAVAYDQAGETTGITQQDASGNTTHTSTFGYDKDGYLTSQVSDGQTSTFAYNNRGLLSSVAVPKSMTDSTPQTTSYTYTSTGLVDTESKPNGNTVSYSYFLDGNEQSQTEDKSDGTLVDSHAYTYDADGNMASDAEQVMSASSGGGTLSHTLDYTYSPSDKVTQVTKDGSVTEQYAYDQDGNISSQTVNGASTTFAYDRNRLLTATTNGVTSGYNYDPLGRLDSITTAGSIGSQYTYDGFDQVTAVTSYGPGSTSATDYTYDPLGRQTSQTTGAGSSSAQTTDYSYLGLSNELDEESVGGKVTKTYAYSPWGERLSQTSYDSSGNATTDQYSYDSHSDVEALTGSSGDTDATYGYTAYGQDDSSMFTGADATDGSGGSPGDAFSAYQFNADRADGPGGYDMGFRDYSSDTGRFLTPDGYDGALQNQGLAENPFTGNPYGFGDGNPLSNIELNGHGWLSDLGHAALSVAGMVPVVGAVADVANAAWYAYDGDYGDAAMSLAGAIPVIGDAVLADRVAVTGVKLTEDGIEAGDEAYNDFKAAENTSTAADDATSADGAGGASGGSEPSTSDGGGSGGSSESGGGGGSGGSSAAEQEAAQQQAAAADGEAQNVAQDAAANEAGAGGEGPGCSFTAGTQVRLASGHTAAISSLQPGDRVESTSTKTGKTTAEQVSAVEVNHDTDLYDLTVQSGGHTEVIHTTSNHLFWDPKARKWVEAGQLRKGESLKTADGKTAVADGGTTPKDHVGWMWDITVPGDNDHDFYVLTAATGSARTGNTAVGGVSVLVHNCGSGARFEVDSQGTATDLTEGDPNILDRNPLEGTSYTEKVQAQIESGDNHGFPALIDSLPTMSDTSIEPGGDGIPRMNVKLPGEVNGRGGVFHWIIEQDGTINHRFFDTRMR
jgi:YD repeat-containing protein